MQSSVRHPRPTPVPQLSTRYNYSSFNSAARGIYRHHQSDQLSQVLRQSLAQKRLGVRDIFTSGESRHNYDETPALNGAEANYAHPTNPHPNPSPDPNPG